MSMVEKYGRTVDDAVTEALIELGATSEEVEIEILEKGATGFLSIFSNKMFKVRVTKKTSLEDVAMTFLTNVFREMHLDVKIDIKIDDKKNMNIDLSGENMGVLIGKRGQTLDSLQYLVSLVVNKESDHYVRIKLDTEEYRERRKKTLEALAINLANKVKKTGKKFALEPMNPYERRIIHSTLQNMKAVSTHSEGEEPYRKVVIVPNNKNI